jgi:hypothetical protein
LQEPTQVVVEMTLVLRSKARRRLAYVLLLCCTGCFTTELWGGDPDELILTDELSWRYPPDAEQGVGADHWSELLYKVPLTPVTLLVDTITFPVQMFFVGKQSEE